MKITAGEIRKHFYGQSVLPPTISDDIEYDATVLHETEHNITLRIDAITNVLVITIGKDKLISSP